MGPPFHISSAVPWRMESPSSKTSSCSTPWASVAWEEPTPTQGEPVRGSNPPSEWLYLHCLCPLDALRGGQNVRFPPQVSVCDTPNDGLAYAGKRVDSWIEGPQKSSANQSWGMAPGLGYLFG
jgi:hypothetical protein